jgi:hypothetical protein
MNSIEADKVPADTLVTYEHMEDGEESTPINLFDLKDIANKHKTKHKPITPTTAPPRLDNVESTSTLRRRKNAKIKVPITPDDDIKAEDESDKDNSADEDSDKDTANHATCRFYQYTT